MLHWIMLKDINQQEFFWIVDGLPGLSMAKVIKIMRIMRIITNKAI